MTWSSISALLDIHRLMGCLAFCHRGLENSPYKDLLDPWMLKDVAENFTKDACMMMELGLESPLSIRSVTLSEEHLHTCVCIVHVC